MNKRYVSFSSSSFSFIFLAVCHFSIKTRVRNPFFEIHLSLSLTEVVINITKCSWHFTWTCIHSIRAGQKWGSTRRHCTWPADHSALLNQLFGHVDVLLISHSKHRSMTVLTDQLFIMLDDEYGCGFTWIKRKRPKEPILGLWLHVILPYWWGKFLKANGTEVRRVLV